MSNFGPKNAFSDELHALKYRQDGESFPDAMARLAMSMGTDTTHEAKLLDALDHMRFMPAGRIQASMGTNKAVTAMNCVVGSRIEDSLLEGENSIANNWREIATILRMGAGLGNDYSTLRPEGAHIGSLDSQSSGPISFMGVTNAICETMRSAGHRRGALMGVLRVDHPDILKFVKAKQNKHALTNFNISVAVTDEFMRAVENDGDFNLRFNGKFYQTIRARDLWHEIMRSTWDWAEPGVLFIDTINRLNPLYYCEVMSSTNPCAEQCLPPNGSCLLGSFNLAKYVDKPNNRFDGFRLALDVHTAVEALDNVIDRAQYPTEIIRQEMLSKRRMGLGVTGVANALETLGSPYGSPAFVEHLEAILRLIQNEAWRASINLAKTRGPFPLFDADKYLAGEYISKQMPLDIQEDVRKYGLRNSHLTSIAPTGTISMCADNVSSGIEPVFAHKTKRTIGTPQGPRGVAFDDYGLATFGHKGRTTNDVTIAEHLAVLAVSAKYVDSAVSKTVNCPDTMTFEEFENVYMDAWKANIKGVATFRKNGKRMALLTDEVPEGAACTIDPETGAKSCG